MAGKAHRNARIQYVGTAYTRGKGTDSVSMHGIITDEGPDWDRPLTFKMSPSAARELAAQLVEKADRVDAERKPKAPVEFAEERPGVWKTATPEDGQRLDSLIDDALANLGTSLSKLRDGINEVIEETSVPAEEWLLVELDGSTDSHAAVTSAKMPLCGRKGVMMPLGGTAGPSCLDCRRALAKGAGYVEITAVEWDEVTHLVSDRAHTWCGVPGLAFGVSQETAPWDGKTLPTCEQCRAVLAERL